MPLKLNCGFSRKVGEPDYGSRGASVNLELELEFGLVNEPDRLQERIRQLFRLAKASVDDELNGNGQQPSNGQQSSNGQQANGNGQRRQTNGRPATQSQVRAIHAIANRQRTDLGSLLRERFGTDQPADLSISEASQLIDELKASTNGAGGRR